MSFSVTDVSKQFFHTPGHNHHCSLTCTYRLTEADGAVYQVTRAIFTNIKEGNIGRKAGATAHIVTPEFIARLNQWESAKFANVLSKTLISAAPAPVPTPPVAAAAVAHPVNSMLSTIQLLQKQISELTQEVVRLSVSLSQEHANNIELAAQLQQTQAQLAQVTEALRILLA